MIKAKLSALSASCFLIMFSSTGYSHDYITHKAVSGTPVITVTSYNIMASRLSELEKLMQAIPELQSDIIALQEVDYDTARSAKSSPKHEPINQSEALAKAGRMYFSECRSISFDGGYYGTALLSRYPIDRTEQIKLPNLDGKEERTACVNYISIPKIPEPIAVIITHPDQDRDNTLRLKQIREIMGYVDQIGQNAIPILIGDLNLVPASPEYNELMYQMSDTLPTEGHYTFPSWNPNRRIDYVLTSKAQKWKIIEANEVSESSKVKWTQISDHLPVTVKIQLLEQ